MDTNMNKTGARVRITTKAGSSGWGCNLILNSATAKMRDGYPESPIPVLGQSIVAVDVTQTGVQAPLPLMDMTNRIEGTPVYSRVSAKTCKVTTVTKYYFKNTDTAIANVSEIGYEGLNRALFVDEQGVAKAWPVASQEEVIVEVEFTILISVTADLTSINVIDQDGTTVDTIDVTMTAMYSEANPPGEWWNLLKAATDNTGIFLVTDQNWDGSSPSSAGFFASKQTELTYSERNIHVTLEHVGAVGGQSIKGYYLVMEGKPPHVGAVFNKTLSIGGNYTFKSELSIDW